MELFESILSIAPLLFFWGVFLIALTLFFRRTGREKVFHARIKILLFATIAFRLIYASLATIAQYLLWVGNPATKVFVEYGVGRDIPIASELEKFPFLFGKAGYFIFYSYVRFWLSALIAILCVVAFFFFLKLLRKWKERFFEDGEIELGTLMVALVGWPAFVVFLPLMLISVILVSLFRLVVLKQELTTMGAPFLLTAFIILLYGGKLILLLNLSVLRI